MSRRVQRSLVTCAWERCGNVFAERTRRVAQGRKFCSTRCARQATGQAISLARLTPAELLRWIDSKSLDLPSGCRVWTGYTDKNGYGQTSVGGEVWLVHRLVWSLAKGPIPAGQVVRHKACNNPSCIRIAHLAIGEHADNHKDMTDAGRHMFGERHCEAKLTDALVLHYRIWAPALVSQKQLSTHARRLGVTISALHNAIKGRSWRHVPMPPTREEIEAWATARGYYDEVMA